jgi:hypothetical protein
VTHAKADTVPDFVTDPDKLAGMPAAERQRLAQQYISWAALLLSVPVESDGNATHVSGRDGGADDRVMQPATEPAKDLPLANVYLTLGEAARRVGLKVNALRNWIYTGRPAAWCASVVIRGSTGHYSSAGS